jgi:D-sedoheptulose 7-phosphate isomerase
MKNASAPINILTLPQPNGVSLPTTPNTLILPPTPNPGSVPAPSGPIMDSYSYFESSYRVLARLPYPHVEEVADKLYRAYVEGHRVFLFGNGGSASLASHFACDLGKGTIGTGDHQKRFKVLALTDNIALITAWANDTCYEKVFAEQLRNFIEQDDIAFAISGSGRSANILRALQVARGAGAFNIGLTGFLGGEMKRLCDLCIVIPSDNMQIIEDLHLSVTHALFTIVRNKIAREGQVIPLNF